MTLPEEKRKEFETLSRKIIEFLNENTHPHTTVIIGSTRSELVEGVYAINTHYYIKD